MHHLCSMLDPKFDLFNFIVYIIYLWEDWACTAVEKKVDQS